MKVGAEMGNPRFMLTVHVLVVSLVGVAMLLKMNINFTQQYS